MALGTSIADTASDIGQMKELRQRLFFVIGALVVFRIGSFIPLPGIDPHVLAALVEQQRGTILEMFNMFSGGSLKRLSIFALGIMPYISASIIMNLLTVTVPSLEQLKKGREAGGARLPSTRATVRWRWPPCRPSASPRPCRPRISGQRPGAEPGAGLSSPPSSRW
jgi:preprotein translocase subunit SecY